MLASLGRSKPFRVYRPRGMLAEANFRYTTILAGFTNLGHSGSCQCVLRNSLLEQRIQVRKGVWKSGNVKTGSYSFLGSRLTERIPFSLSLERAFKTNEQWGERESRARIGMTKEKRMGRGRTGGKKLQHNDIRAKMQ